MPARLKRIRANDYTYPPGKHRLALDTLLQETSNRCAYSQQHIKEMLRTTMEVDHFNPTRINGEKNNAHGNLLCASRHCNGHKSAKWPTEAQFQKGIRLLNPYEEADYGKHIFEIEETGELVGITSAGRWHVRKLCLNDELLVEARLERTELLKTLEAARNKEHLDQEVSKLCDLLERKTLKRFIPILPILPKE